MSGFNNPGNEVFQKHSERRRKCWLPAFSPFYVPALIDRGHIVFGPSVCLSAKTFTLAIAFE